MLSHFHLTPKRRAPVVEEETVPPSPGVTSSYFFGKSTGTSESAAEAEKGKETESSRPQPEPEPPGPTQSELLEIQTRLQHIIDQLQAENEELKEETTRLKQQLKAGAPEGSLLKERKNVVEMYAEVLTLLEKSNREFNMEDNLPRVVVVGDQSAGKTSVLEMVAHARIFPRGGGEMMTRTPVQVTLSEGPTRVAQFGNDSRLYNLRDPVELQALRDEIERRMKDAVKDGNSVSPETISLNVRGPGLPRMVLVDLPGIISHVTAGMAASTKNDIVTMARKHMNNPNAIILCIQDGSVDAERSSVADVVSEVDPKGERTIFVLTKVDVAEKGNANPERMRQMMEGRLFRMKAINYFAVVTGTGSRTSEEDIDSITKYETEFFKQSTLFQSGVMRTSQTTTSNLAHAVQREFWKRVRSSVEQQLESLSHQIRKKNAEWSSLYSGTTMSRNEFFERGKLAILESMTLFGNLQPVEWERAVEKQLWPTIRHHSLETLYVPARAKAADVDEFRHILEDMLIEWQERAGLTNLCFDISHKVFINQFESVMQKTRVESLKNESEMLFGPLKREVGRRVLERHVWNDMHHTLREAQRKVLSDLEITSEKEWKDAVNFMQATLEQHHLDIKHREKEIYGPSTREQWISWKSTTQEKLLHRAVKDQLRSHFKPDQLASPVLKWEDLAYIRKDIKKRMQYASLMTDATLDDLINNTYAWMFQKHFLKLSIASAKYCRSKYAVVPQNRTGAPNGLQCRDVLFFKRVEDLLHTSSKYLRQTIVEEKARMEREVAYELEQIGKKEKEVKQLVTGKRVELSEQIETAKQLQAKLEQFLRLLSTTTGSQVPRD
eukprot:TRINITY_DN1725_c0_g1_i5.p1 TRINITY_DN1725_c0_g1~~TRINITY_DN1725_c0_g1_i5.p1  ORF type:complete len:953 (-),score=259.51 TRINITY_DN1725_c0_g1_i5:43-2553(-)